MACGGSSGMDEHGLLARHCRAAVRMPGALRRAGGSRAAAVLPSRGAFPGRNDAVSEARALQTCTRRRRAITMIRRFTPLSTALGRASRRERAGQYLELLGSTFDLNNK